MLLETFLRSPRSVLSTDQLKDSLYGMNEDVESNALNVHIHHLRRMLGSRVIEAVRGLGLAIVNAIAERFGGSLDLRRLASGGLEACLTLPLKPKP